MSIKRTDRMREVLSLLRERGEVASRVMPGVAGLPGDVAP